LPAVAPVLGDDVGIAPVLLFFSLNVYANDNFGVPPATFLASTFVASGACSGLSFNTATGVLSGVPTAVNNTCSFDYSFSNSAGTDSAHVSNLVF